MKLITAFFITILYVFSSPNLCADDTNQINQIAPDVKQSCEELKQVGVSSEELARRGCCSHHKGVCGCSGGRQVCCDGTLSPSCTCNKPDPVIGTPKS